MRKLTLCTPEQHKVTTVTVQASLKDLQSISCEASVHGPRTGGETRNFDTLQKLESSVQSLMQNIWQLQELADAHRSQGT